MPGTLELDFLDHFPKLGFSVFFISVPVSVVTFCVALFSAVYEFENRDLQTTGSPRTSES